MMCLPNSANKLKLSLGNPGNLPALRALVDWALLVSENLDAIDGEDVRARIETIVVAGNIQDADSRQVCLSVLSTAEHTANAYRSPQ